MLIAAVSGEPRGIEAQDGSNLVGAQPRNQAVKSRAADHSACRSSEIIVDDPYIDKTPLVSDLDQRALTPLAFQIGHDLGLRRLAHVNDSLALQDGGGITSVLVIVKLLDAQAGGLQQDLRQQRPYLAPFPWLQSRQALLRRAIGSTVGKPVSRSGLG
jgi:hypothetical protein